MIHLARPGELLRMRLEMALIHAVGTAPLALLACTHALANEVAAMRAEGVIALDGDLDQTTWRDAPMPDDCYEIDPGDHSKPAVHTTARFRLRGEIPLQCASKI
jgi:hypothetical protein